MGKRKEGIQSKKRRVDGSSTTNPLLLLQPCEFHDYACAKAFDILSKGMYKKFLSQSRNAGEQWACKVVESVVKVQSVVSGIHALVEALRKKQQQQQQSASGINLSALSSACIEVMDMAVPPKKRVHGACSCSITGAHLASEEGIEILRQSNAGDSASAPSSSAKSGRKRKLQEASSSSKEEKDIVVHPRLSHFFSMLWLVCRIDHILRNLAKNWMATSSSLQQAPSSQQQGGHATKSAGVLHEEMRKEEVEGISMCQRFSEDHAECIEAMGLMFLHAASHVEASMQAIHP